MLLLALVGYSTHGARSSFVSVRISATVHTSFTFAVVMHVSDFVCRCGTTIVVGTVFPLLMLLLAAALVDLPLLCCKVRE